MDYYDEITKTQEAARMATFAKMVGDGIAQNLFDSAFTIIADKEAETDVT